MRFGPWEIVLVVVIVLILFGARRIPELMKGLGTGIREFKTGLHDEETDSEKKEDKEDNNKDKTQDKEKS